MAVSLTVRRRPSKRSGVRYAGEDRRSHRKRRIVERHPLPCDEKDCYALVSAAGAEFRCPVLDVAVNSCSLRSPQALALGSPVKLQLRIFGGTVLAAGRVMTFFPKKGRTKRYGILFDEQLPSESVSLFDRHHDRRAPQNLYDRAEGFSKRLEQWKSAEFYHYHRSDTVADAGTAVNFTTNDYLGLSKDMRIIRAAQAAVEECGLGTTGPSIFAGDLAYHDRLCAEIANLKGMEACLLCPSGFTANSGLFTGLLHKKETLIFLDERDHASIFHGAMACPATLKIFRHNDMSDLRQKLSAYDKNAAKIIVIDGVYSMDGDLAPLGQIHALAKEFRASLWVDDAHSFGVFGEDGGGIESHFRLRGEIDVVTGSLGKSLGGFGGFVCAKRPVIEYLEHLAKEFVYTAALPAAICAGALESLRILRYESAEARKRLWENTRFLKKQLTEAGFPIGPTESPIVPVIFGHETLTQRLARELYDQGIQVNAVTRPAVRRNAARLRLSVRANHTVDDLARTVDTMIKIAEKIGLRLGSEP